MFWPTPKNSRIGNDVMGFIAIANQCGEKLKTQWLSDEPELESDFHRDQIALLVRLLQWYWRHRSDVYCSANTTVYFDPAQRTNRNFRSPDVYVVFGTVNRPRNSWMVGREGNHYFRQMGI